MGQVPSAETPEDRPHRFLKPRDGGARTEPEPRDPHNRPPGVMWNYSTSELVADGVVHAVGVTFGLCGAVLLVVAAIDLVDPLERAAVVVYALGLVAMLSCSAAYNITPISRLKWRLRRFDHSAIFVMIAGTYTPFITQLKSGLASGALLIGVWSAALTGAFFKVRFPGRYDRLSIALYLLLSASGMLAYDAVVNSLSLTTLQLLAAGAVLYTTGIIFHVWDRLPFQNAIWHTFVLLAAACHYGAVLDCLVFSPASG